MGVVERTKGNKARLCIVYIYFCLMVTLGLSKMVKRVQNSLIKVLEELGLRSCTRRQMKQKEAGTNFCTHLFRIFNKVNGDLGCEAQWWRLAKACHKPQNVFQGSMVISFLAVTCSKLL